MPEESWVLIAESEGVGVPIGAPVCGICSNKVYWITCPTGGWWAHFDHPTDEHDAESIQIDDGEE